MTLTGTHMRQPVTVGEALPAISLEAAAESAIVLRLREAGAVYHAPSNAAEAW